MRVTFLIPIFLMSIVGIACATLPSDDLDYRAIPVVPVSLSGVSSDVPQKFALENPDLEKFNKSTENGIKDLGHFFSGIRELETSSPMSVGITDTQIKFAEKAELIPEDVGNSTNGTNVTEINGIIAYF
jgi:hypothetical protein